MEMEMEKCIEDMPREVIICISQHLTWKDIINLSNTCVWFKLAVFYEMKNRSAIFIRNALIEIKKITRGDIVIKISFSVFRGRCFKKIREFRLSVHINHPSGFILRYFSSKNKYYGNPPLICTYPLEYIKKCKVVNKSNLVI